MNEGTFGNHDELFRIFKCRDEDYPTSSQPVTMELHESGIRIEMTKYFPRSPKSLIYSHGNLLETAVHSSD